MSLRPSKPSFDRTTQTDRGEGVSRIFVARGEVNATDNNLILVLMGRLGLDGASLDVGEWQAFLRRQGPLPPIKPLDTSDTSSNCPYRFSDITSRQQYLTLEHFEDFGSLYMPRDLVRAKTKITSTFNDLVSRRRLLKGQDLRKQSEYEWEFRKRVAIKSRVELGIEPYTGPKRDRHQDQVTYETKEFAVEAGSIIDLGKSLREEWVLSITDDMLVHISNRLLSQITEET